MASDRDAVLVERRSIDDSYHVLGFEHPEIARDAQAGQFVMLKPDCSAELPLRRPYSILDADSNRGIFRLLVKVVGSQSRRLAELPPGAMARCLGPLGRPFQPPATSSVPLLIGGGFGIAPLRLFCVELQRGGLVPRVFYGGRTAADLPMRSSFEELGVEITLATEDGSFGTSGRVTVALERYLDSLTTPATLYACGPGPMLAAVALIARKRGLPAQVSLDPWIGCGMGACLGCVVRTQKRDEERPRYRCACTEGPVFDAAEVVWPEEDRSWARQREVMP